MAVWDGGPGSGAPAPPQRSEARARVRASRGVRKPRGTLDYLWAAAKRSFTDLNTLPLLILFIAMVAAAIQWLVMIVGGTR